MQRGRKAREDRRQESYPQRQEKDGRIQPNHGFIGERAARNE